MKPRPKGKAAALELSWPEAAEKVLTEEGHPMHYQESARLVLERGSRSHQGKTPWSSLVSILGQLDSTGKGPFRRIRKGIWGLASWPVPDLPVHSPDRPVIIPPLRPPP